ncbi:DUF5522 domain-containing protein [Belliella kenyensis]|nr:DUF5522 domain-containing protein [Belliella kenyensis]MDN3602175.1 DUF5522 domain-containing protein [Belliella kenyensis]
MKSKKKQIAPLELISGDYYINEDGLMVFTTQYHKRRGYCCANECKHCPYKKIK